MDKLNTNTEMEEMINDYNTVSPLWVRCANFCDTSHLYPEEVEFKEVLIWRNADTASYFCVALQVKAQNNSEAESIDSIFTERRE